MNTIDYSTALSDLHESGSRPDSESGGLDRLVVACHVARDAYQELDWNADDAPSGPAKELLRIAREQAWEVWQRMERAGLPLLQEWQRDNGLAPASASDNLTCCECGNVSGGTAWWWDTRLWMESVNGPVCPVCAKAGKGTPFDASDAADSTPRDGEQLGPLVYEAGRAIWRYSATYSERALAERRADSLQAAFVGVPFGVALYDGEWTAACVGSYTPQLRAAAR